MFKKILVNKERKLYWKTGDVHSKDGIIKEKELKKTKVKTNKKVEFKVLPANLLDNLEKIKRGPAIVIKKDIGSILANTDLDKNSIVLEAGSGSGHLTISLSRYVKKVISYEKNKQFYDLTLKNLESLNIKNVKLENKDIYNGIKEKVDAIILDLDQPWNVLTHTKTLKQGGYLVSYLPNITQVKRLVNEAEKDYHIEKISETIEREWVIDEKRARPKNMIIGHTAWLVFLRKL